MRVTSCSKGGYFLRNNKVTLFATKDHVTHHARLPSSQQRDYFLHNNKVTLFASQGNVLHKTEVGFFSKNAMPRGIPRLLSPQSGGYFLRNNKVTLFAGTRLLSPQHMWRNLLKMGLIDKLDKTLLYTSARRQQLVTKLYITPNLTSWNMSRRHLFHASKLHLTPQKDIFYASARLLSPQLRGYFLLRFVLIIVCRGLNFRHI